MTAFVLDASVAAKWFLPSAEETLTAEASLLLWQYAGGQIRFIVPDLFWAEVGNVFWKSIRQDRFTEGEAQEALQELRDRNLPTVGCERLLGSALTLALTFGRSVYDGLYVALAVDTESQFITADERLANALASHLPVKWLGAI